MESPCQNQRLFISFWHRDADKLEVLNFQKKYGSLHYPIFLTTRAQKLLGRNGSFLHILQLSFAGYPATYIYVGLVAWGETICNQLEQCCTLRSLGGQVDRSHSYACHLRTSLIKSRIIKSLLHNLAQVRFESVPGGESWSVEKTGNKRLANQQPNSTLRGLPVLNYLDRWPNDCILANVNTFMVRQVCSLGAVKSCVTTGPIFHFIVTMLGPVQAPWIISQAQCFN